MQARYIKQQTRRSETTHLLLAQCDTHRLFEKMGVSTRSTSSVLGIRPLRKTSSSSPTCFLCCARVNTVSLSSSLFFAPRFASLLGCSASIFLCAWLASLTARHFPDLEIKDDLLAQKRWCCCGKLWCLCWCLLHLQRLLSARHKSGWFLFSSLLFSSFRSFACVASVLDM